MPATTRLIPANRFTWVPAPTPLNHHCKSPARVCRLKTGRASLYSSERAPAAGMESDTSDGCAGRLELPVTVVSAKSCDSPLGP